MNVHTMKIAVSLPAKTLRSVETTRRRLGRSRSSIVAEALESWLKGHSTETEDAQYIEAYVRHPEPEDGAVAVAIMATWDDWETKSTAKTTKSKRRIASSTRTRK